MGTTVPGAEPDANIEDERSSHVSIDSDPLKIVGRPEHVSSVTAEAGLEWQQLTVIARPPAPADGGIASQVDVYAALTAAMVAGCVPPPRVSLHVRGDRRTIELEFPQSYPGARTAVDSWAVEFGAVAQESAGILAVRYGFEPADCRERFATGWGLRVFTHLDLPPALGGVDAAGVWREPQPHGVGSSWVADSHTAGGCPVSDCGAPTISSPVGLEGARPGPDSGAQRGGVAVGGGPATDQTSSVVVLTSRRGALGGAAHTNPSGGEPA